MRPSVLLLSALFGLVLSASSPALAGKNAPPPAKPVVERFKVPLGDSPARGPRTAPVTLVGFIDYECPFSTRAHGTVKALQAEYGTKLRYVVKQRPLPFHGRARAAAAAALAAGEQGAYWRMHDVLVDKQEALEDDDLQAHAASLGMDAERFQAAADVARWNERFEADEALATSVGATGTPTFFVNGRKLVGAQPVDAFRKLINEELATARAMVASGTAPGAVYDKLMEGAQGKALTRSTAGPLPGEEFQRVEAPAHSPTEGPAGAPVTLVAWMDFQCPFCLRASGTLKELRERYGDDLRVVFRHQPLDFHEQARAAALASMAAHQQGRFWEMAEALFEHQAEFEQEPWEQLAESLGLDLDAFRGDLSGSTLEGWVDQDIRDGKSAGARGTPTFFINGRKVAGAQSLPVFKKIIDEERAAGRELLAGGTPPGDLYDALLARNAGRYQAGPGTKVLDAEPRSEVRVGSSPALGPGDAPVTLVVFADFECPFCARAVGTVRQLREAFGDKLRVVFKHHPLPFHPNARGAALAAAAAGQQGKFWEMHDRLFADPTQLGPDALVEHARELGLDVGAFKAALKSARIKALVDEDIAEAARVGATGTPTFFVNGRKIVGAQPYETFRDAVNDAL
jgi:protein-disulfide isomerase